MDRLELKIPPLIVGAAFAAAMGACARFAPLGELALPWRVPVAVVLAVLGVGFVAAGVGTFRRVGTTVHPRRPERASTLVVSGIYAVSRNPMYVGMLLALAAWAVILARPLAYLCPPAFVAYMNRFQIAPEERAMAARFGEAYEAYRRSVRRWL